MDSWISTYVTTLENLTPETLVELEMCLADKVEFRDPFNHSFSRDEMMAIMHDMFDMIPNVGFAVHRCYQEGNEAALFWTFSGGNPRLGEFAIAGSSQVKSDSEGQIIFHHDYWDASELLVKVPLLGRVITAIKRKISHKE